MDERILRARGRSGDRSRSLSKGVSLSDRKCRSALDVCVCVCVSVCLSVWPGQGRIQPAGNDPNHAHEDLTPCVPCIVSSEVLI